MRKVGDGEVAARSEGREWEKSTDFGERLLASSVKKMINGEARLWCVSEGGLARLLYEMTMAEMTAMQSFYLKNRVDPHH